MTPGRPGYPRGVIDLRVLRDTPDLDPRVGRAMLALADYLEASPNHLELLREHARDIHSLLTPARAAISPA